ncbi:MAG: sensor domain-containing diguanylate cyclase [Spirochaetia bacterium]
MTIVVTSAVPLASLYFIAAAAGVGLLLRISRDPSFAAQELLGLAASVALWAFFYGFEILSQSELYRQLWSQVAYIGIYGTGAFLLRFAVKWLHPSRQGWWLQLVWIVPVFMVLAVFTNEWHGLVWPEIRPSDLAPYVWFYGHGPVFWVGAIFQYLVVGTSVVLITLAAWTRRGVYRRQALLVLAGVAVAVVGNAIYLARLIALPLDITPMALAVSTGIFYSGVSRARLLDLLPAARHRVVDLMPDGLLVLDENSRVIDWNTAALTMWGISQSELTGTPVADLVPLWSAQIAPGLADSGPGVFRTTLRIDDGLTAKTYVDVDGRRFSTRSGGSDGWIVVFRDASEIRRAERDLQDANKRLETLNKMLLSQAMHDSLTGLFNRAYLDEALPRELARCRRDGSTIALLILDVDHFKSVNDTYGHDTGDLVLREVARLVRGIVRAGDIPCRFGGDEIVAVMPGAPEAEVAGVAERMRQRVSEERFGDESARLSVTVSVGFAIFPVHADSSADLFRAADRALYAAKDAGRDRTMSAAPPDRGGEPT